MNQKRRDPVSDSTTTVLSDEAWLRWRRHLVGGISVGLIIAAGVIALWGSGTSEWQFAQGVALKSGLTLFMLWLALPQLERSRAWTAIPVGILLVIAITRPQLLPVLLRAAITVAPVLLIAWVLWKLMRK